MAIYHCSIKIGSRSSGRSAVSAAAYRAAEKLQDHEIGLTHDYTRKSGVIHSEIMLPNHAPREYADRETLWNAVQKIEKQSNAQLFREIEVALPKEMSADKQLEAVREYIREQFVSEGMCADFAIHDKGDGNPHVHIMLTTRGIKENGEWGAKERKAYKLDENGEKIPVIDPITGEQKIGARGRKIWERETVQANDWNDKGKAETWRAAWADECNKYLEPEQQIDHRSYERQGIDLEPTRHVGIVQQAMKQNGKALDFDKTEINAEIRERNRFMLQVKDAMKQLHEKIGEKARSLYERIAAIAGAYGYVGTTGELAYDTGTTTIRNREAHERVRGLEGLVREATGTDREIENISQAIREKTSSIGDRIARLFAKRDDVGRSSAEESQRAQEFQQPEKEIIEEMKDTVPAERKTEAAERERPVAGGLTGEIGRQFEHDGLHYSLQKYMQGGLLLSVSGWGTVNEKWRRLVPTQQLDRITDIDCQEGITEIGNRSFWGMKQLSRVSLPGTIRSIGFCAMDITRNNMEIEYHGSVEQWNAIQKEPDSIGQGTRELQITRNSDSIILAADETIERDLQKALARSSPDVDAPWRVMAWDKISGKCQENYFADKDDAMMAALAHHNAGATGAVVYDNLENKILHVYGYMRDDLLPEDARPAVEVKEFRANDFIVQGHVLGTDIDEWSPVWNQDGRMFVRTGSMLNGNRLEHTFTASEVQLYKDWSERKEVLFQASPETGIHEEYEPDQLPYTRADDWEMEM